MLILSSILIFAALGLAVMAVWAVLAPNVGALRLSRLDAAPEIIEDDKHDDEMGLLDEERSWLVRLLAPLAGISGGKTGASDKSNSVLSGLRLRLVQAGFRKESSLVIYLGGRLVLALALPVLVWAAGLPLLFKPGFEPIILLLSASFGYIAPSYWLDTRLRRRQEEIDRNLPTALDLMVVCIEAGLGLVQSLSRVGAEMAASSPVIAEEFELVHLEARTGKSNSDALRSLARRTGVREVSVLVAMLTQTERFGTSLADALRVHCDTMRVTRMQRAEERAAKAPLKMLVPTAMILFALLTLILGLAVIKASAVFSG